MPERTDVTNGPVQAVVRSGDTIYIGGRFDRAANFRTDVNVNGSINASDIGLVKSRSGTALP